MELQHILDNLLCRDHLFSFLDVNDLLRLRRVGKSTKTVAENYIQSKKVKTKRELVIEFERNEPFEEYQTFKNALSDLPIKTKMSVTFFAERHNLAIFRTPFQDFLDTFGENITELSILDYIGLELPGLKYSQWFLKFLGLFPNVKHLMIECIEFGSHDQTDEEKSTRKNAKLDEEEFGIPASLKELKTLRITRLVTHQRDPLCQEIFTFLWKLVEACISNLERLYLPFDEAPLKTEQWLRLICRCLFSKEATKLKLEDVPGTLFDDLLKPDNRSPETGTLGDMTKNLNDKVISICKPTPLFFLHDFPNLEQINFGSIYDSTMPNARYSKREWTRVKKMSIFLLEDLLTSHLCEVFEYMFGETTREKLEILDFTFVGEPDPVEPFPLFGAQQIVTSCSNLKTLDVGSSIKQLVDLRVLWTGLPNLEELHLQGCRLLKDNDFIGEDEDNPAFFKLTRLKVLEMTRVCRTDVTDGLFSKVLCHMPLKKLSLSSGKVVESISLDGIKSLLTGKFANSIERLSLRYLELEDSSLRHMENIEKMFRSYRMM